MLTSPHSIEVPTFYTPEEYRREHIVPMHAVFIGLYVALILIVYLVGMFLGFQYLSLAIITTLFAAGSLYPLMVIRDFTVRKMFEHTAWDMLNYNNDEYDIFHDEVLRLWGIDLTRPEMKRLLIDRETLDIPVDSESYVLLRIDGSYVHRTFVDEPRIQQLPLFNEDLTIA